MKNGPDKTGAHELLLYTVNDSRLYFQQAQPIILNLARKMKRGIFSLQRSVKLWEYLAESAAKKYATDFGGSFSKSTRHLTARELARHYFDEVKDKYRTLKEKGYKKNPAPSAATRSEKFHRLRKGIVAQLKKAVNRGDESLSIKYAQKVRKLDRMFYAPRNIKRKRR